MAKTRKKKLAQREQKRQETRMYGHNGNLIITDDFEPARMQNQRSEWVISIPLPFYGLKKRCSCGATFWRESNYNAHYALRHIVLGELPL